jgi:RNA polymerase sigma factor (sigma-70 family)
MSRRLTNSRYPYPVHENNEDDMLDLIMIKEVFPTLDQREKVVLSLRIQGYTQGSISRILNISRTSIGSIEKKATQKIADKIKAR